MCNTGNEGTSITLKKNPEECPGGGDCTTCKLNIGTAVADVLQIDNGPLQVVVNDQGEQQVVLRQEELQ